MPTVSWFDRLRIEKVVWSLDQQLYDLPRKARIATRREVRQNLLTAAQDVGAPEALRRLGGSQQLAAEYLSAELGDEPRPSWIAATTFLLTGQLLLTSLLSEAAFAFRDGVLAAEPGATGTFRWPGIAYLQDDVTVTFAHGQAELVGGAWTPLAWGLWLLATVLIGRLWRYPALWRRRRSRAPITTRT
jgi:hypothetical protein